MRDIKKGIQQFDNKNDSGNEKRRRHEHEGAVMAHTARKRVENDSRQSHEELRNLAARLQSVREEERRALSRE
ncbi:MAG: hypothetical protein ABIJ57_00920, partial [Pseudomonadota bacterium]